MSSNVQNALQKVEENGFHKLLRTELIMIPIPKAKFFDRKVPSGVNRQDFEDEIIEKQAHVLQSAISRVSLTSGKIYDENPNHDSGDSLNFFFSEKHFIS